jgi:XTP/dITP diphosphohydrolase
MGFDIGRKVIKENFITIVFATQNPHKVAEVQALLGGGFRVLSLKDFPPQPLVLEDGDTFESNAQKKALALSQALKLPVLADDSGLEVDALGGRPGVHSSRYGGAELPHPEKIKLLLGELSGVPAEKRQARFVCVMALARPNGSVLTRRATVEGRIAFEVRGNNGFGYDPIFYLPDRGCTTAELSLEEKNALSHRAKALRAIRACL